MIKLKCKHCSEAIKTYPCRVGKKRFCSQRCNGLANKKVHFRSGHGNPLWKAGTVGVMALHNWVRRHKKRPTLCECCKKKPPIDLANVSQEYKRDIDDFEWLCRRCHMAKDGRLKKIAAANPNGYNQFTKLPTKQK